jgi:hypothetical protein
MVSMKTMPTGKGERLEFSGGSGDYHDWRAAFVRGARVNRWSLIVEVHETVRGELNPDGEWRSAALGRDGLLRLALDAAPILCDYRRRHMTQAFDPAKVKTVCRMPDGEVDMLIKGKRRISVKGSAQDGMWAIRCEGDFTCEELIAFFEALAAGLSALDDEDGE